MTVPQSHILVSKFVIKRAWCIFLLFPARIASHLLKIFDSYPYSRILYLPLRRLYTSMIRSMHSLSSSRPSASIRNINSSLTYQISFKTGLLHALEPALTSLGLFVRIAVHARQPQSASARRILQWVYRCVYKMRVSLSLYILPLA
jgi:hypothetical protein